MRPFAAARAFARSLNLTSEKAWRDWRKGGARPPDIPSHPDRVYKGKGWAGYESWLGTEAFGPSSVTQTTDDDTCDGERERAV